MRTPHAHGKGGRLPGEKGGDGLFAEAPNVSVHHCQENVAKEGGKTDLSYLLLIRFANDGCSTVDKG